MRGMRSQSQFPLLWVCSRRLVAAPDRHEVHSRGSLALIACKRSPTFLKVSSSFFVNLIANLVSMATIRFTWERESHPSTSLAVVSGVMTMSGSSKTSQNIRLNLLTTSTLGLQG